jgi:hypothetical protein
MSWSISGGGKPSSVITELANQFRRLVNLGAEERELKDRSSDLIFAAIRAQPIQGTVYVSAMGTIRNGAHIVSISISGSN